jgi:NAD(P)-dependent dehydrogenase (short-subunit alcohol dehydrogenase family)
MMKLKDKVAVITGASNGIGKATASLFADHGAKIVVSDIDEQKGMEVVQAIRFLGGEAEFIKTDVSQAREVERLMIKTREKFGALHILFNNAGIMNGADGDSQETSEEIWDLTFNINVKGVFFGCKYGIPLMKSSGGGSIINTASFVAHLGAATAQLAYTSSKGAVLAMSRELAIIHARQNIRVNALCPGPLRTKLLMDFLDTEEKKQRRLVHIPMGRFGEAEEMAKAALFLACDDSSYMTGSEFLVDGGITSAYVTPE